MISLWTWYQTIGSPEKKTSYKINKIHHQCEQVWSCLFSSTIAFIKALLPKIEWSHTPHVKCSPRTNRLRSSTNDTTPWKCAEGKSFVDTAEDVGVAGRPLSEAQAPIQLMQVTNAAHVTHWFMRRRQCLKKLRNAISRTLEPATSLTDRSSSQGATNLCVLNKLLPAQTSELLETCSAAGCSNFAFLLFFFTSSAQRLTHSRWPITRGGVCHLPLAQVRVSALVAIAPSTQGLWVAVVSEVVWLTRHQHLGPTHNVTVWDTPLVENTFFFLSQRTGEKYLCKQPAVFD